MDSSPLNKAGEPSPSLPQVAGKKRPASTLLPPFEPLSSSPGLPRMVKKPRGNLNGPSFRNAYTKYPTPVPTSSTGILSSSPPQRAPSGSRPALQRTQSAASERAPLCAVPSIELSENGDTLLMGRSSNSSNYQLSSNRLISRVHVKARYVPATEPLEPNGVEIVCCGWNGLKLHCQGRTWELGKGDTFTSETENTEIMLDVQDARVRIQWPKKDRSDVLANLSDSSWDESPRPKSSLNNNRDRVPGAPGATALQSSPLRGSLRIASPESPTPAGVTKSATTLQSLLSQHGGSGSLDGDGDEDEENDDGGAPIKIYEDASADEQELPQQPQPTADQSFATDIAMDSFSSELSDVQSDIDDNEHEDSKVQERPEEFPDEENDPIILSFGPFGANLSDRLASFTTGSPKVERRPVLSRIPSADGSITSVGSGGVVADSITVKHRDTTRPRTPHQQVPHAKRGKSGEKAVSGTNKTNKVEEDQEAEVHHHRRHPLGVGLGITMGTTPVAATSGTATTAATPAAVPEPEKPVEISSQVNIDTVRNHLVNQLAFSRLSSSPLSTIMNNLPAEERKDLTREALRFIIEDTVCVGVIPRQGKDAAGKPLESEYYYMPEKDSDESRRAAVVDGLRKPSLRNCRKQHKQYYWKRPRTP